MDNRRLDQPQQDALRRRGVTMVREGKSQAAVARELGVRPATVSAWMKAAAATSDILRLASKPRGARHDQKAIDWVRVQGDMHSRPPREWKLRLRHDIWTIAAVMALLRSSRYGVTASRWVVADHIYQAVLPNHRPENRSPSWRPESMFSWREGELAAVKAAARDQGAALWYLAGVNRDMVAPPVTSGDDDDLVRRRLPYFMSAFSARRELAFLGFYGNRYDGHFSRFVSQLRIHVGGPVHLVIDDRIKCMPMCASSTSDDGQSRITLIPRHRLEETERA